MRTDISDQKGFSMPADSEILTEYIIKHFPYQQVASTYESCCFSFRAIRAFLNLGWSVTVVNPADILRMNKQSFQKTEKIDCSKLCKQLQQEQLKAIYILTEAEEEFRNLLRQRNQVVKHLRNTMGIAPRSKLLLRSHLIGAARVAVFFPLSKQKYPIKSVIIQKLNKLYNPIL